MTRIDELVGWKDALRYFSQFKWDPIQLIFIARPSEPLLFSRVSFQVNLSYFPGLVFETFVVKEAEQNTHYFP